ncbi:prepilin-type N-terminal cleavage/methylation domain-containing protein [Rubellicoccus peritrichatus]|uniref:Prepilin-type N-terminal cleavage/methylation domain-containing protein n=1 Tax=Rubellicoccus peritrichatus TaxID=3080537 RepID=A0AAQ3QT74_9BACT|nr:prepilin-type N-terminal cleavage/methylation domain-containing protein [Puniceicoccus sp. CR14]WOO43388.1 prepilin-type N-terminal cleavage/methylation domain-containing protein [Puniceicoccus sp. CR14]
MRFAEIHKKRSQGFTLVEIMAATGIMLVIILLVLTLTTNVLSSWTRSSGQLSTNFEARVALDLLTSDLESVVIRNRPINWVQLDYQRVEDIDDSPVLYFFAPALERPRKKENGDDILGDVCAISYRLDFDNPFIAGQQNAGNQPVPTYGLYRSVVDAENTFNHALSIANIKAPGSNTIRSNATLKAYWDGDAINSDGVGIAQEVIAENGREANIRDWVLSSGNFLSQNVADFQVVFWFRDQNGILRSVDPPERLIYADQLYLSDDGSNFREQPGARLEYVDVSLTILSREGASALNLDPSVNYDDAVQQYGEVFTRRINLMSSGF